MKAEHPKIGDQVKGSWRDPATGKTYYQEGIVREYPAGLFVQSYNDGGITPVEYFFYFTKIIPCKPEQN